MSLDLARLGALLANLPDELRPTGSCQLVDLAAPFEPDPTVPTSIVGLGSGAETASALARVRRGLRDDQPVWLLWDDGAATSTAGALDERLEGVEAIFVPPVEAETAERSLAGLRQIVHRLRAPGGCPWDQKQTHQTLAKYVLEEAYEVVDAIEHHGPEELSEELGDLLLQVFLQSELSEQDGGFTLNDVVERITTKLIRRHPHVFGDVKVDGASDVEVNWEALKKAEKSERVSVLDGVPRSLPALTMAAEIQKRMKKAGYRWLDRQGVEAKLAEELRELQEAATPQEAAAELGDVLFVLTELASWHDATAEDALRGTITRVEARFRYMEDRLRERGLEVSDAPVDELLALWEQAKALGRQPVSNAPAATPAIPPERAAAVHDALLSWYARVGRDLPWRRTRDPYAILVSEIMLQQTQVDRVIPKYHQFLAAFPTLAALAAAPLADVIRVWAGLGYNRRAVRLHAIARQAVERLGGQLPASPDALRELDGLGTYTANAVACFSGEAQVGVVDTNVRRVLGRVFADEIGLEPAAGPKLQQVADALVPEGRAYAWNQALMDLGATVCTARAPAHDSCPLALQCTGRTMLAAAAAMPRAAEAGATYQTGLPGIAPARSVRPSTTRPKTAQPFEQTTRYFRGRIVAACRDLDPGKTLGLDDLGRALRPDFSPEHLTWIADLVEGLRRDGLVAVDDATGEPRVSLP